MAPDKILKELSSGDAADIVKRIEKLMLTEQQFDNAQIILRKLSSVLSSKSNLPKLGAESIEEICKLCCQAIIRDKATASDEVDYRVITSVYHIVAYLRDNDHFASFLQTLHTILPVLEPLAPSADDQQMHVFVQLGILVYNECVKKFRGNYLKEKTASEVQSTLLELWQLILRVSLLSKQNLYLIPRVASQVVTLYQSLGHGKSILQFQEVVVSSLKEFCSKCIDKKTFSDSELNEFYVAYLCATRIFYENYAANTDWEGAFALVKGMVSDFKALIVENKQSFLVLCFVEKFLGTILFSTNSVPSNELFLEEVTQSFNMLNSIIKDGPQNETFLQWGAFFINNVITPLKRYWCAENNKITSILNPSTIYVLHKLLTALSKVLEAGHCSKCVTSAGDVCELKEDVPIAYFIMEFILCLTRIHNVAEEKTEVFDILLECVKHCEELAQVTVKKKCLQADDIILRLCENTYVVWAYVKNLPDSNFLPVEKLLLEKCKDLYFYVHKISKESFLTRKSIGFRILTALAKVYWKLGEEQKGCVALATALSIAPELNQEPDSSVMQVWVEFRDKSADKELSLVTLLMNEEMMKGFWADYHVGAVDIPKWLLWDMESYSSFNTTNTNSLIALWKKRKEFNLLPLEKIQACLRLFRGLLVCNDFDLLKKYEAKLKIEAYHALLKKIPSSDQAPALCSLAALAFTKFMCSTKLHMQTSEKAMKEVKTFEPRKQVILSAEDVVDVNDICTTPPPYPGLAVSKDESLLFLLDPANSYWEKALEKGLEPSHSCYRDVLVAARCLPEAAVVCRLYGLRFKERRLWETCRTFGQRMGNDKLILQAVSGLMDLGCCEPDWVMRAEAIASTLKDDISAELPIRMFKNSCILHCLLTGKLEEGLVQLNELLSGTSATKWSWCMIQTNFYLAKYQLAAPNLFPKESNKAFYTARLCLKMAKQATDEWSNSVKKSFDMWAMTDLVLSVSSWLGNLYLQVMLPREARCYLKGELVIAQKLGLALRSAQFISLLAQVDLLVENVEECTWKIEAMKQILDVTSKSVEQLDVYKDEDCSLLRVPKPDVPNDRAASPELKNERFRMPDFAEHKKSCSCFSCTNLSLHTLWVDVGYLQACVYFFQFNVLAANNFFKNSIRLAKDLRQKQERLLDNYSLPSHPQEGLIRTEVKLKIKYTNMLTLCKKDTEATSVNKAIFSLIDEIVPKDAHLFMEALEQQIILMDLMAASHAAKNNAVSMDNPSTPRTPVNHDFENSPEFKDARSVRNESAYRTPLRTNVKKGRSRSPLKAITPECSPACSDSGFLKPTGYGIRLFCDSDESSEEEPPIKDLESRSVLKERQQIVKTRETAKVTQMKEKQGSKKNVASASSSSRTQRRQVNEVKMSDGEEKMPVVSSGRPLRKRVTRGTKEVPYIPPKFDLSRLRKI